MSKLPTTGGGHGRYATALSSIRLVQDSGLLGLVEEDLEFLMMSEKPRPWINTDRVRAKRCIESVVFGTMDYLGLDRMAAPAEFVAGVIAYFVNPYNQQIACEFMKGVDWCENIIQGVHQPVSASSLFAHVLQVSAGLEMNMEDRYDFILKKVAAGII